MTAYSVAMEDKSPPAKRSKLESTENLMDALQDDQQHVEMSPVIQQILNTADMQDEVPHLTTPSPHKCTTNISPVDSKENVIKSPKNKFAVQGKLKRERFNLNAKKQDSKVCSRWVLAVHNT